MNLRRPSSCAAEGVVSWDRAVERIRTTQIRVQHLDAQVERLGDVPLRARADAPLGPVVVATGRRNSHRADARAVAAGLERAQHGIGRSGALAVRHLIPGAVQRGVPSRGPVMLVASVEAPGARQLAARQISLDAGYNCATVHAVAHHAVALVAEACVGAACHTPVGVRGIEQVA